MFKLIESIKIQYKGQLTDALLNKVMTKDKWLSNTFFTERQLEPIVLSQTTLTKEDVKVSNPKHRYKNTTIINKFKRGTIKTKRAWCVILNIKTTTEFNDRTKYNLLIRK